MSVDGRQRTLPPIHGGAEGGGGDRGQLSLQHASPDSPDRYVSEQHAPTSASTPQRLSLRCPGPIRRMVRTGTSEAEQMPPERERRPIAALAWCALALFVSLGVGGAFAQTESQVAVEGTGGRGLNVRAEPDSLASVLAVAPEGALLMATGPEVPSGGRLWRPVRMDDGVAGWVAAEFVVAAASVGAPATGTPTPVTPVAALLPAVEATPTTAPTLTPTVTPTPGPPLDLEIRFKFPELRSRDEQTIYVDVFRGGVPQPGVEVHFTVEDEDPEIERVASLSNNVGRSSFTWHMRRYKGTTVVRVYAVAPDRGEGKATGSFFVR